MLHIFHKGALRERLQQILLHYTYPTAQLPRWRHPLVGYCTGLLLVGLSLVVGLVETQLLVPFSFPGALLLFAVVIVALLWSVGPAIFVILLSLLVLDYLYVPPFRVFGAYGWNGILQLLTFASASIIIAILTHQRESALMKTLVAEREAAKRARQLEATFEAVTDGVVVYDRPGHVLQTNAAAEQLFGVNCLPAKEETQTRDELLVQAVQRDACGQLLPESRQPLFRLFHGEALASTTDVLVHTPDGRKVMLNMSGAPIRGETERIEQAVLVYRDVTERRQLEQRTSEALRSLLALAEVLVQYPERPQQDEDDGTALGEFEQVGQRIVELTQSVVQSMHVVLLAVETEEEIVYPIASVGFTLQQEQQWREQLMTSPNLVNYLGHPALPSQLEDNEMLMLDGMTLPLYTHVLPYYIQTVLVAPICLDHHLIGMLCVDTGSREHTYTRYEMTLVQTIARLAALILTRAQLQRERAEVRANELALREANRRMEEFIGLICHELKTPLTVMKGNIQLAEQKMKRLARSEEILPEITRRFAPVQVLLERARSQVSIQDRLVNDLLDVSRIQAQALKLIMEPCNLVSIIQEAVADQRQIAPSRTIEVEVPAEKTVPVYADADRIVQVLTNYLTNALNYSAPDHPVGVHLSVEEHRACVSVHDEGPGIPLVEQKRIWERFYRVPGVEVHGKARISGGGLGLGLHLCRAIIEGHHGQVGVQSSPGEGSIFWFILPLAEQERAPQ